MTEKSSIKSTFTISPKYFSPSKASPKKKAKGTNKKHTDFISKTSKKECLGT